MITVFMILRILELKHTLLKTDNICKNEMEKLVNHTMRIEHIYSRIKTSQCLKKLWIGLKPVDILWILNAYILINDLTLSNTFFMRMKPDENAVYLPQKVWTSIWTKAKNEVLFWILHMLKEDILFHAWTLWLRHMAWKEMFYRIGSDSKNWK